MTSGTTRALFGAKKASPPLRVPRAVAWLTVHRAPDIPGEGARYPFVGRTFKFQTVIRAKTAQNLTIYLKI